MDERKAGLITVGAQSQPVADPAEPPSPFQLLAGSAILFAIVCAGVLIFTPLEPVWPYWWVAGIGLAIGGTELMARYRDAPFAPIASVPGFSYMAINAGAAILAYYLIGDVESLSLSPTAKILTAGIGAMAFFRSGVFTTRFGDTDVAVGPNMILQIMLQALDRAYDRDRARPRSEQAVDIMKDVSFAQAKKALPSICFNLMQNVPSDEQQGLAREVEALELQSEIPDEARSLILGLALMNIVGEKTLRAAVKAIRKSLQDSNDIDPALIEDFARVDPDRAIASLPRICNSIAYESQRVEDTQVFTAQIVDLGLDTESTALLMLHALAQHYGPSIVRNAVGIMLPG